MSRPAENLKGDKGKPSPKSGSGPAKNPPPRPAPPHPNAQQQQANSTAVPQQHPDPGEVQQSNQVNNPATPPHLVNNPATPPHQVNNPATPPHLVNNPATPPHQVNNPANPANPSQKKSMPNLNRRAALLPVAAEVKPSPSVPHTAFPDQHKHQTVVTVEHETVPAAEPHHAAGTQPHKPPEAEQGPSQPTSVINPNYGKNSPGIHNPVHATTEAAKHEKKASRDDYVFLTPPHEGEHPVKAWPVRDSSGFHTPPHGTGAVILKDRSSPVPPPARKGSFLYSSEDEHMGLTKAGANETDPLLKPNNVAQDILNRMLGVDRDANRFDDFNWWCFRKQTYAMPSCFTNQTFRQTFGGQMLGFKALQMVVLFLCSIIFQMIWTWDSNTTPPGYYNFITRHFWITPAVFAVYLGILFFVRVFHIGRLPPRNWICYAVMTLLMGFISFAGSVGLGDMVSALSPVLPLALIISYVVFYLLIIPKQWRLRVDILERKMYYLILPIALVACLASWSLVFGLLQISGSVYLAEFEFIDTFLLNASASLALIAIILLIEIYRIKRIIEGTYISIMADDEALFASFFV